MATGNAAQLQGAKEIDSLKPTVPKKDSILVFMSMFAWKGTAMPTAGPVMMLSIGYAAIVKVCMDKALDEGEEWSEFTTFYAGHVGVTTFFLVFFVGKCYGVYLEALGYCRGTQGRLQDMFLLTSMHPAAGTTEQVHKFRRYILAAPWAVYGGLDSTLEDDAKKAIKSLVDADDYERLCQLAPAGKKAAGDRPLGAGPGLMLISLAGKQVFQQNSGSLSGAHLAYMQDVQEQLMKLRAQLGSMFDIVDDTGGIHLGYTQLLSLNVACLLMLTPFGLYTVMGWYILLATPMYFMHFFGLLVLARNLQLPFRNTHNGMRLQHRVLLQEHENYWDRYPVYPQVSALDNAPTTDVPYPPAEENGAVRRPAAKKVEGES